MASEVGGAGVDVVAGGARDEAVWGVSIGGDASGGRVEGGVKVRGEVSSAREGGGELRAGIEKTAEGLAVGCWVRRVAKAEVEGVAGEGEGGRGGR